MVKILSDGSYSVVFRFSCNFKVMSDDVITNMDDIEQECEDAVFEVCDARERYPAMCANELARCIRLENEICVEPIKCRPLPKLCKVEISNEQKILWEKVGTVQKTENDKKRLMKLLAKMEDLKIAAEQIERKKYCDINRLLKK